MGNIAKKGITISEYITVTRVLAIRYLARLRQLPTDNL